MTGKKKKVLDGHKKVGSKFIPPMLQLGMTELSYVNQILPEIIWMGLINQKFGFRDGLDIVTKMTELAFSLKETSHFVNFTLASSYNSLSEGRKRMLVEKLEEASYLDIQQASLAPIVILYREFPLSFIGPPSHFERADIIQAIKTAVKNCIDKYDTPSLAIQTNVLYLRGKMGGLFYTSNIKVPDLNSLIDAPESEEAKRAAGFVRNGVMSEFMPMGKVRDDAWARAFWNQGYKIDACDFSWEDDEHAE